MSFKIDENLPIEVAELLRQAGHDAVTVLEEHLGGCTDASLAAVCRQEKRALVTLDMDFAEFRGYPPGEFPGFVVLRPRQLDKPHVLDLFTRLLKVIHQEPLAGHLWIVEEGRIRLQG
jgi:predicted nuclease of predicted toxin-antitoxin system